MSYYSKSLLLNIIIAFMIYWCLAGMFFAFRHPYLTNTQIFLHTKDALLLKTISTEELND